MISGAAVSDSVKAKILQGCVSTSNTWKKKCEKTLDGVLNNPEATDKSAYVFERVEEWCAVRDYKSIKEFSAHCVHNVWSNPGNYKHGKKRDVHDVKRNPDGTKTYVKKTLTLNLSDAKGSVAAPDNNTTVADALKAASEAKSGGVSGINIRNTGGGVLPHTTFGFVEGKTEEERFDANGNRAYVEFAEDKPADPTYVSGSVNVVADSYSDAELGDETGLTAVADLAGVYHRWPGLQLGWEAGIIRGTFPSILHDKDGALVKDLDQINFSEFYFKPLVMEVPLGGSYKSISDVNLIGVNAMAGRLEAAIVKRLGQKGADVFIHSVLRPGFIDSGRDFETAWKEIVTEGLPKFEAFLKGEKSGDAKDWQVLFQFDPMGAIDAAAVRSGKTSQEAGKAFKDKLDVDAFAKSATVSFDAQTKLFEKFVEAQIGFAWSNTYKDVNAKADDPSKQKAPAGWEVRESYWRKVEAVEGEWKALLGDGYESKLKSSAENAKIPYPFDTANDPGNPWAMQYLLNRFNTAAKKAGLVEDPSDWLLNVKLGWQDYNSDDPGLGVAVRVGTSWLGASVYLMPVATSNLLNPELRQDIPAGQRADTHNYFHGGVAVGGGLDGALILVTGPIVKKWGLSYGATVVSAGLSEEDGADKHNFRARLGTDLTLQTGPITHLLSGAYQPRIRWTLGDGNVDYRHVIKAGLGWKFPQVGPIQLGWQNNLTLRLGSYGADHKDNVVVDDDRFTRNQGGNPTDLVFDFGQNATIFRSAVVMSIPDWGASLDAGFTLWHSCDVNDEESCGTQQGFTVGMSKEF